ncbi:Exo endo phos domain containing protein [Trichuris trichiura]|uniref:Exo endo phos domain containing protein n=1 Tax=Trichuris trichiura TaxID=36087 RepID=A0A077Z6D2_TRITR|nr:Exo endo phos domain containing protein [Trichuris trichiura]
MQQPNYSLYQATVTGYIFWTLLFRLTSTLCIFDFHGFLMQGKVALQVLLAISCIMRLVPSCYHLLVRAIFHSEIGETVVQVLMVSGLLSYFCTSTLAQSILAIGAVYFAAMKFTSDISRLNYAKKKFAFWGYTLGLVFLQVSRINYTSVLPVGYNCLSNLAISLVGIVNAFFTVRPGKDRQLQIETRVKEPPWEMVAVGFGTILTLTYTFFGDPSMPTRWSLLAGMQPYRFMAPNPGSIFVFTAFVLGLRLSWVNQLLFNPLWLAFGAVGLFLMLVTSGATSFLGATFLATYLASMWPHYFNVLSHCSIGRTMVVSVLVYLGELTCIIQALRSNERSFIHVATTLFSVAIFTSAIWFGLYVNRLFPIHGHKRHIAFNELTPAAKALDKWEIWRWLLTAVMMASSGMLSRYRGWNPDVQQLSPAANGTFLLALMTAGHGTDKYGWPNAADATALCQMLKPDVVLLLETENVYGGSDLPTFLGEKLNYYIDYGITPRHANSGIAVVSRYPIIKSNYSFYSNKDIGVGMVQVLIQGIVVTIFIPSLYDYSGTKNYPKEEKFVAEMVKSFTQHGEPTLVAGNFFFRARHSRYNNFVKKASVKDIDYADVHRYRMFIFYQNLYKLAYSRISSGRLKSDDIQVARFEFASPDKEDNTLVVRKVADVPRHLRFDAEMGDYSVTELQRFSKSTYHMASTKYFLPRPSSHMSSAAKKKRLAEMKAQIT